MNTNRTISAIFVAFLIVAPMYSQGTISGKVVDVLDGRTLVMETANGPLTASIQFVDVPEPEQPLSRLVREHLANLALSRTINFVPAGFSPQAVVGRAYLNGVDFGQQLLRDGAAWHAPQVRTGQDRDESLAYLRLQELAKAERRGIWAVEGITPPWEFRSQRGVRMTDAGYQRIVSRNSFGKMIRNYEAVRPGLDMWIEMGGEPFSQKNAAGTLFWGYDSVTRIRNTSTPSVAQLIASDERLLEVEIRAIFFQGEIRPRAPNTAFVIALLATARSHSFEGNTHGRIVADGIEIDLGIGQRFYREDGSTAQEMLQYRIGGSDLRKIVTAKSVTIQTGRFSGDCNAALKDAIRGLLDSVG